MAPTEIVDPLRSINRVVEELSKVSKKPEVALAKITELATLFSKLPPDSSILNGRACYIGNTLLKELQLPENAAIDQGLLAVLCESCNFKNALQVEAVFYGPLSTIFDVYLKISQLPYLRELWMEMPAIFRCISYGPEYSGAFHINLAPLTDYFSKLDLDGLDPSFASTMAWIFHQFEIRDGELIVPFDLLPSASFLEEHMESSDLHSKLLAQLLYVCVIEEHLVYKECSGKLLSAQLFRFLKDQPFDLYLSKKPLVPLLANFLESSQLIVARGLDTSSILFDAELLLKDHRIKEPRWLEESARFFESICHLEQAVRGFFKPSFLKGFDRDVIKVGYDQKVFSWVEQFQTVADTHGLPIPYSINRAHPFVSDRVSFERLPYSNFLRANYEMIELLHEESAKEKASTKSPSKSKEKKTSPTKVFSNSSSSSEVASYACSSLAMSGACTKKSEGLPSFEHAACAAKGGAGGDDEEGLDFLSAFIQSSSKAAASLVAASLSPSSPGRKKKAYLSAEASTLAASMESAQDKLRILSFHPRVKSWHTSAEAGLDFYGFGHEGVSHELSREDMILRHRLPKDLLLLALNPHYGIKKSITLKSGDVIDEHYETCLLIDGKKYVLEASINHLGVVFHFYARRVTKVEHYQQMLSISDLQFAMMRDVIKGAKSATEEKEEFASAGSLTFNKEATATCLFDGHTFEVPILKTLGKRAF